MTTFWQSPAGGLFKLEDGDGGDPSWTELTELAWDAALSDAEVAIGAADAASDADACQARKAAYQDLHSTIPALHLDTVSFLTGWHPGDC